jgi:quercetin dioxygenase-like cupin family protein
MRATTLVWFLIAFAPAARAEVSYFPAAEVTEAFAKGSVLYAEPGVEFMVHASRREKAGEAEVHVKDADVIYVLGGTATFVTGGRAVDAREIEPGEIRGREIEGGQVRVLAKGDVIIVPAGTPHWFKEVKAPFLYYVVKVR